MAPLQIVPCQFGLSNYNYKISCEGHEPLILRLFGPVSSGSNENEEHILGCGFGAHLVQKFDWGRLESWLPGRPMQREDCSNIELLAVFARELRLLHSVADRNHNDLNFTNILVCDFNECLSINLLDFEYSGPLDPPYDVANFFCEWMYDYGSPRWFEPNPEKYPSIAQARSFIAQYLEIANSADDEVSTFLEDVQKRIPNVHKFWIDWAMTTFSDQKEYLQYAEQRQTLMDHMSCI